MEGHIPFGQFFFGLGIDSYACRDCAHMQVIAGDEKGNATSLGLVHGVTLQPLRAAVEQGYWVRTYFDKYVGVRGDDLTRILFEVAGDCNVGDLAGRTFAADYHRNSGDVNALQNYKKIVSASYLAVPA